MDLHIAGDASDQRHHESAHVVRVPVSSFGRRDREWVEVRDGLAPGTLYVTANSYLIKADIEKAGARHDH